MNVKELIVFIDSTKRRQSVIYQKAERERQSFSKYRSNCLYQLFSSLYYFLKERRLSKSINFNLICVFAFIWLSNYNFSFMNILMLMSKSDQIAFVTP